MVNLLEWGWESQPLPPVTLRMLACEYLNTHLSAQLSGDVMCGEYEPELIDAEFRHAAQANGYTFADLKAEADQLIHEHTGRDTADYVSRIDDGPDGWMEIDTSHD